MCVVLGSSLGGEGREGGGGVKSLTQLVHWLSLPCEEKGQREDTLRESKSGVTQVRL